MDSDPNKKIEVYISYDNKMSAVIKSVLAINLAVILLQACVLGFQINRWNEVIGAIFSIIVCFIGYLSGCFKSENPEVKWLLAFSIFLMIVDLLFQLVNMVLLICFQWVVIQYCIYLNASVDISDYGGVACNDWWHFGYGEINYRDRALVVTVLMATVVILRFVQTALSAYVLCRKTSQPTVYITDQDLSTKRHHAQVTGSRY